MVLRQPSAAHNTHSSPLQIGAMSTTAIEDPSPPRYSAQNRISQINETLPDYNDPSHNFAPVAPAPSRTKQPPPPEATSDLEANENAVRVPANSLNTAHNSRHLAAPRPLPNQRARVCAGIGIVVIVLAAVLFFAAMFWPHHSLEEKETVAMAVVEDQSTASGGEGIVFRRDGDVKADEVLVDDVLRQGGVGGTEMAIILSKCRNSPAGNGKTIHAQAGRSQVDRRI